ncbi:MAG: MFS transporter [Thiohalocapsa sp.]
MRSADRQRPNPFVGLFFLFLIMVAAFANSTIFSVLAPDLIRELQMDQDSVDLATTIFLAIAAGLLVPMGQVADLLGRRRLLLIGAVGMILASIYGGLATHGDDIVVARTLQAVAFAMTVTTGVALLNVMFPREEPGPRGIAFGVYAAAAGIGFALGPLGGGYFSTDLTWRWAFFANVPLFILVIAGVLWAVPRSEPELGRDRRSATIDLTGAVLLLATLASLIFSLDLGRKFGWLVSVRPFAIGDWQWPFLLSFPAALGISTVLFVSLFLLYEARRRRQTPWILMDFELFRIRRFTLGALVGLVFTQATFALIMVLPIYLQFVLHYDAMAMGQTMISIGLGASIFGVLAAPLGKQLGARNLVLAGVLVMAAGQLFLIFLLPSVRDGWDMQLPLLVFGAGFGMAFARVNDLALVDVPKEKSGIAGGMLVAFRLVGGAVGIALLTAVFLSAVDADSRYDVDAVGGLSASQKQAVLDTLDTAARSQPANTSSGHPEGRSIAAVTLDPELSAGFAALRDSYVTAAQTTLWIGFGLALVATILALLIPPDPRTRKMPVGPPLEDPRYRQ